MSVWVTIPSARPAPEVNEWAAAWHRMGYKIALWRDYGRGDIPDSDFVRVSDEYPGYAQAVNSLAHDVFHKDPHCDWIVAAGDDTLPDPKKCAGDIASECSIEFGYYEAARGDFMAQPGLSTFGVMQPTGDPWSDRAGRIIERIAGSPWLGREWCRRANGGHGPMWPEYTHCFSDEELQCVAQRLGVFWQRSDLTHMHNNWARARGNIQDRPAFLVEATSAEHWRKYSSLFKERKAAGFPGSEPIA